MTEYRRGGGGVSVAIPGIGWTLLRLPMCLLALWAAYGFFIFQHGYTVASDLAAARALQAERLSSLPQTAQEHRWFGPVGPESKPTESGNGELADRIAAAGVLTTYFATEAESDFAAALACGAAALSATAIFLAGVRDGVRILTVKRRVAGLLVES
jgi:hypothetical protein